MTVSNQITAPHGVNFAPVISWLQSIREGIALRRDYRRTLNELSRLSALQLEDLGLHRATLRQTAYQSTYHQFR